MAWQTGSITLSGTIGGLTYCRNGIVRAARRSDKHHFRTAPSLARTRENATEFGTASHAAAQLRAALRPQLGLLHTRALCSRLTSRMRQVLALDTQNPRGQRRIQPENSASLVGFSLNPAALLPPGLADGCTVSRPAADCLTIHLPPFSPSGSSQRAATHYTVEVSLLLLDFPAADLRSHPLVSCQHQQISRPVAGSAAVAPSASVGPIPLAESPVSATSCAFPLPPDLPASTVLVVTIGLQFYQFLGGQFYPLHDLHHRPLAITFAQPLAALPVRVPELIARQQPATPRPSPSLPPNPSRAASPPAAPPGNQSLPAPSGSHNALTLQAEYG